MSKIGVLAFLAILVASPASGQVLFDPFLDPLAQGYQTEGTEPYASSEGLLLILDQSFFGHRTFFKTMPEIATSTVAVEVDVRIDGDGFSPDREDTGVRVILSQGANGDEIGAALIQRDGLRRVALVIPGGFSQGFPFFGGTFRLERTADGRGILTVGAGREVVFPGRFPAARRAEPSLEFGAASFPALANTQRKAFSRRAGRGPRNVAEEAGHRPTSVRPVSKPRRSCATSFIKSAMISPVARSAIGIIEAMVGMYPPTAKSRNSTAYVLSG